LPPDVRPKCTKFDSSRGFAPDPAGGAFSAPSDSLAGFQGPACKGREEKGKRGEDGEGKICYCMPPNQGE